MTLAAAFLQATVALAPPIAPEALLPFLDPEAIIRTTGPWALLVVCAIIFAETGLLVGFILPGDTLLVITGIFAFHPGIGVPVWVAGMAIALAAFAGGELGYYLGKKSGPALFERKESGLFSIENVRRTSAFFHRFGGWTVILARFVPVVRTMAPLMAGVGHMNYRRYSLYNAIGALVWGMGLTMFGWALPLIPPIGGFSVSEFVKEYIDLILLAAVLFTVLPIGVHYLQARIRAKRDGGHVATHEEITALMVDLDDEPGTPWDGSTPGGDPR